jgi:hypothetical protein
MTPNDPKHSDCGGRRNLLQGMAASAGHVATVAENYVELAKTLGVTRCALQNWRKRKDAPNPAANGLHEVAAWREFMQRHGLEGDPAGTDEESALRARKLLAEVEERELRLAVKKREFVAMGEVQHCWTAQVAKAKELLRHKFEFELPPIHDAPGVDRVPKDITNGKTTKFPPCHFVLGHCFCKTLGEHSFAAVGCSRPFAMTRAGRRAWS